MADTNVVKDIIDKIVTEKNSYMAMFLIGRMSEALSNLGYSSLKDYAIYIEENLGEEYLDLFNDALHTYMELVGK